MTADDAGVAPEQAAVAAVVALLLETDALTPNSDGTPTHYIVEAENIEYLVRQVLTAALAANLPADDGARAALVEVERRIEAEYDSASADAHTDNITRDGGSFVLRRAVAREHWADALRIVREVTATLPRADNLAADQHADEAGL